MKQFILFLMLAATGLSTSNAQTDFPCTAEDFNQKVRWLDYNVYGWPETAKLNVSLDGTWLYLDSDKKDVWPNHFNPIIGSSAVAANVWAIVQNGGQWYAVTWEWIPKGRREKFRTAFDGGHMKRAPFFTGGGEADWWQPKRGEIYGLMLSDFARFGTQTYATFKERSNVAWYKWEEGEVDVCAEPEKPTVTAPVTNLILGN